MSFWISDTEYYILNSVKRYKIIVKTFCGPQTIFPWDLDSTLESGINIRVRLLIFEVFSRGYILIKGGYVYWFWFLKNFLRILHFLFLWLCIKESNYLLFKRGLRLFKGLCLLFLPNVPGAMFIQGGTFIPDSRVNHRLHFLRNKWILSPFRSDWNELLLV